MADKNIALRKRTQIDTANKMMFVWVAGVSVIVGFAAVAFMFLFQQMNFNHKVIAEKQKTVAALDHNLKVIDDLRDEVRALDSDPSLLSVRARSEDRALQVVLDALPSDANSLALGASLQNVLLANIDGLAVESLRVDPVKGIEHLTNEKSKRSTKAVNYISLRFTVLGSDSALQEVMRRLERSIRTIEVNSLTIESRGNARALSIQARAYFEPAIELKLEDKAVKP